MADPLTTTWPFALGELVLLPTGRNATVTRRIESISRDGDVSRIYTCRAEGGAGPAFSIEAPEASLRVPCPPPGSHRLQLFKPPTARPRSH